MKRAKAYRSAGLIFTRYLIMGARRRTLQQGWSHSKVLASCMRYTEYRHIIVCVTHVCTVNKYLYFILYMPCIADSLLLGCSVLGGA